MTNRLDKDKEAEYELLQFLCFFQHWNGTNYNDLHQRLIHEHLENWNGLQKASIEYYFKTGKVSGSLYLALMEYAEAYYSAKIKVNSKQ